MRLIFWASLFAFLAAILWLLIVLALLSIFSPKVDPTVGLYVAPTIGFVVYLMAEVAKSPPSTWPARI
ncbi:MAG: hypothetical protein U0744_02470 [Gemmataceae bacterium]